MVGVSIETHVDLDVDLEENEGVATIVEAVGESVMYRDGVR